MPWIRLRDYPSFYHEILNHSRDSDGIDTEWLKNHDIFRDFMMTNYNLEVQSGPVGPDRRFYLDDRNYLLFLLRWS